MVRSASLLTPAAVLAVSIFLLSSTTILQLPPDPAAYADSTGSGAGGTQQSCTNHKGGAEDSRLSVKIASNYYDVKTSNSTNPDNTTTATIVIQNKVVGNGDKIENSNDSESAPGAISMQIRLLSSYSNETLKPAQFSVVITAKNTNQTILADTFASRSGILVLKMQPAVQQQQGEEEAGNRSPVTFIPDKKIAAIGLRIPDENDTLLVRSSGLFEKGETYVADISLVGMEEFFCDTDHLPHLELTWTLVKV